MFPEFSSDKKEEKEGNKEREKLCVLCQQSVNTLYQTQSPPWRFRTSWAFPSQVPPQQKHNLPGKINLSFPTHAHKKETRKRSEFFFVLSPPTTPVFPLSAQNFCSEASISPTAFPVILYPSPHIRLFGRLLNTEAVGAGGVFLWWVSCELGCCSAMSKSKNFMKNLLKPFQLSPRKGEPERPMLVSCRNYTCLVLCLNRIILGFPGFNRSEGQSEEDWDKIAAQEQKHFSFESLVAATKNFHPSHKLGQGGFGPVYRVRSLSIFPPPLPLVYMHMHMSIKVGAKVLWLENSGCNWWNLSACESRKEE